MDDLARGAWVAGNRLHAVEGGRAVIAPARQRAISVNDQFRICFVWTSLGPKDVEFVDYSIDERFRVTAGAMICDARLRSGPPRRASH